LNLHSLSGSSSVEWLQGYLVSRRQPLTWYKVSIVIPLYYPAKLFHLSIDSGCKCKKRDHFGSKSNVLSILLQTTFDAPAGVAPLALDMASMGKGQVWINGQSLGRYWPAYKASGSCGYCNYAGSYSEKKCASNCGEASQRW